LLKHVGFVSLPSHAAGGYDHADVHLKSGKVYIAHRANGSLEVADGEGLRHIKTIPHCPEASGVLCAQEEGLVFAAARGAGKVLVVGIDDDDSIREIHAGSRPNGLAWDSKRKQLFVADVEDNRARLLDPDSGRALSEIALKGRPRWSLYEPSLDVFLVNIRDPAGLMFISPERLAEQKFVPVSVPGPHGLEAIPGTGPAFVACDGKAMVALDLVSGRETAVVPLSGEPDVLWLNPQRGRLYCAIGSPGVIDVIDINGHEVDERVVTEEGAHTLTFDRKRQQLYALMPKSQGANVYSEE
jgi:DNA-binding beta-propeller fold protein YncE